MDAERSTEVPAKVAAALGAADEAIARGDWLAGVQQTANAAFIDIRVENISYLKTATQAGEIGDRFARGFAGAGLARDWQRGVGEPPYRVAFVLFVLAPGQAATRRLVRVIEQLDRDLFEPYVIVTDEMTRRSPEQPVLPFSDAPSRLLGAEQHDALQAAGAPVLYVPVVGDHLFAAREGAQLGRALELDLAMFIGSPACPIMAGMAWSGIGPVQVNQNIGVPLVIEGMDAAIYHSRRLAETDREVLSRRGISVHAVSTNGTDVSAAEQAEPMARSQFGVPVDAVILMCLGNKLEYRLGAGEFLDHLGRFMTEHPQTYFLAMGRGDLNAALRPLAGQGLGKRLLTAGSTPNVYPVLKAADVFLNEYPEGGVNTVMEAMACGTPAVAMAAGEQHTHCQGAHLLGEPWAVMSYDPEAYWRQVSNWVRDPAKREAAGAEQQQRCRERYDYTALAREYQQIMRQLLERASAGEPGSA